MNKAAILGVILSSMVGLASAVEIEARVFRFTADAPQPAEILRMNEAGILSPSSSFIANLQPDGSFIHSVTEKVPYTTFDKDGKSTGTKTCEVGISFSGTATRDQEGYSIQAALKTTDPAEIRMDRADNGTIFPQSVFHTRATKFMRLLEIGTWKVAASGSRDSVILVRVRD